MKSWNVLGSIVAARTTRPCARRITTVAANAQYSTSNSSIYQTPANPLDYGAYRRNDQAQVVPEEVAANTPALRSLHARLGLSTQYPLSTLARTLICRSANLKYVDNVGLSNYGKTLLSFYVHEYFMKKYPRLPPSVLRHLVDSYTSVSSLAHVGSSWGVESDNQSAFARYLADETEEDVLGKLAYAENTQKQEPGLTQILDNAQSHSDHSLAMATFVRALVAGVSAHDGLAAAKTFVYKYLIQPRKIDVASIMMFDQPTKELATLCQREGLERPVSRLMAETGRYSKAPVFVVGVFSGKTNLGEGQGASLNEARTRAAVHALKSWYLYSPLPSDNGMETFVDSGVVVI